VRLRGLWTQSGLSGQNFRGDGYEPVHGVPLISPHTSAALILFFAFAALAATPQTDIKVLATALGLGILLDATIVRALLVPALVSLFGRYNWWLPAVVAKVLRVEPSPLTPDRAVPRVVPTGGLSGCRAVGLSGCRAKGTAAPR
jgi:hypothetical protein